MYCDGNMTGDPRERRALDIMAVPRTISSGADTERGESDADGLGVHDELHIAREARSGRTPEAGPLQEQAGT